MLKENEELNSHLNLIKKNNKDIKSKFNLQIKEEK